MANADVDVNKPLNARVNNKRKAEAEETLADRKQRLKTFYIALSRKHKQILESPDLLSREDRDRVLDHCCKRLKVLHREICQVTSLEKGKDTAIDARQTQPARFPLIHGCSHGGLVAGLSDEEAPATQARPAPDPPLGRKACVPSMELCLANSSSNNDEIVPGDLLPDPDITVRAGPPPAACTTAGQTQLAAQGQACLVVKTAKKRKKRKEKRSKLGANHCDNIKKDGKSQPCEHAAEADGTTFEADLGETRAPDAANKLADGLEAAAQEEATNQPADPTADQKATEADGTPSTDAEESGVAPTAGVSSAARHTADELPTLPAAEIPNANTAAALEDVQAAATAVGDASVGLAGLLQPSKRKQNKRHKSGADTSDNVRKGSKSKSSLHEAEANGTTLKRDLCEMRAPDAAAELADGLKAAATGEQPEDAEPAELNEPPAEPSIGQPAGAGADQEATTADALASTPSGGACKSAPTAEVSTNVHNISAQPAILAPDEVSNADTADQAAATAGDSTHVGPAGSLNPYAQPDKRKKSKSGGNDEKQNKKGRKGSKCESRSAPDEVEGYEADRFITPPKRTMTQPYVARQGEWVAVNQMSCINGDGHGELYTTGNSVFVLGADDQPYVCGESLCLVCDQASMVQDRGSDLVECDRCMGAVHLHCAALSKVPKGEYLCPKCKDGTRDLGQNLFKAKPGVVQTLREQLLSGNNRVRLAQIVAMRQHMSAVGELDEVYDADVRWYEVPRDRSLGLDCTKFKVNEVLVPEGEVETVSCAVFIRKAFVSSRDEHSTQEVQAEEVDTDDALYCSGQYRHADREVAEDSDATQSSSQSQSMADSDDDEDYEPESLSKHKNWSCSASEDEGGEQSKGWEDDLSDGCDYGEGAYCGQSKGLAAARERSKAGKQSACNSKRKQKRTVPLWVTAPDDVRIWVDPDLLAAAMKDDVSREEQLRNPLSRAVADLNPGRPWDALYGRKQEVAFLRGWVTNNFDGGDKVKYVLGPAGSGKTLTVDTVVSQLQALAAQDEKYAGWLCVRVNVQYTRTLPQFFKLLSQAILGDIRLSQRHEEALDNLFGGVQPTALKKLVLAMDNFDQLATHCKQALTKLGAWRKQFKLKIMALSCLPVSVPKILGGLGPKNREFCLQPYKDDTLKNIIQQRLTDARVVPEATISRAIFKMRLCGRSNVRDVLDTLYKAAQAAERQHAQPRCAAAASTQAPDCVTPDHVESVFKEQVKSSMLDSLLQLSRRDTRLLMLVHRGTTTRSHANVEDVGYLADAIQKSQEWEEVPFHEVEKSVQQLIHAGMLQAVNKEHGPGLQVRLGAACQEVEQMMRVRVLEGPLF